MNFMNGITFSDWMKLLTENHFNINIKYMGRVIAITINSILNSRMKRREDKLFFDKIKNVQISDPIFIIGHWRSGTTLVQKLLSLDNQFAFPNLFQVTHPHTFLYREDNIKKALGNQEAEKRPMDNMKVTFQDPGEDESAISILSQRSPLVSWGFPKRNFFYTKFHTFENADKIDLEKWKSAMIWFLKKLTFRYNKTLVLKSPIHTGRIKILTEMFPNAKFIHIIRNPYTIYSSTKKLYDKMLPTTIVQNFKISNWDNFILDNYSTMYRSFINNKHLIKPNNLIEIHFEDFENNKIETIRKIYQKFSLKDFEKIEPKLKDYLSTISEYKKNSFKELDPYVKEKIIKEWGFTFSEFGYEL
ncbi:MAG: sulfotransferase [Melioribacteraceae bacterium]